MVIMMNKTKFIEEISNKTGYSLEDSTRINTIIENNFIISKKSKCKIIDELQFEFNISFEEAEHIYEVCAEIISTALKKQINSSVF